MRINGKKVKAIREQMGKKRTSVAQAADLGERRIAQIEDGELVKINLNIAKAIAKTLKVKLEELT